MSAPVIRAAGGLLWRPGADGAPAVAVVHRARYDDWSLPKGKVRPGEPTLLAAIREVGEETGRTVTLGRRLPSARYLGGDRKRLVQYWEMRDLGPSTAAAVTGDEVDELRWLPVAAADQLLNYPSDRRVLRRFHGATPGTGLLLLVRHALAGRRADWQAPDRLRPLDARGHRQAAALAAPLAAFRPATVIAPDLVRCQQTLAPLADRLGCPLDTEPALADDAFLGDPQAAERAVRAAVTAGGVVAVCAQGTAVPGLLERLLPAAARRAAGHLETRKAAWWAVGFDADGPSWADRYHRPG